MILKLQSNAQVALISVSYGELLRCLHLRNDITMLERTVVLRLTLKELHKIIWKKRYILETQ